MKIYDISVSLSDQTPVYEGDPRIQVTPDSRLSKGDSSNVSTLTFGSHSGTHVDPPFHMLQDGITIDQVPLDCMIGECFVCDLGDVPAIGMAELEAANIPDGVERIIFKSRNSDLWKDSDFQKDFTYLAPDGADWIAKKGIRLVGIDYLSVDKFHSGTHPAHCRLMDAGIIIVEGLCLLNVPSGKYTLVCLPLKIKGGDGGPARAVLIEH
jgi:arylformamidase